MTRIDIEEWTKLVTEGLEQHRDAAYEEGYELGYKDGYLAALEEIESIKEARLDRLKLELKSSQPAPESNS